MMLRRARVLPSGSERARGISPESWRVHPQASRTMLIWGCPMPAFFTGEWKTN